jgi:hypothetical protein
MIEFLATEISATAWSVVIAILPLAVLFLLFQIFLLRLPRRQVADILVGTVVASLGLFLFLLGIGIGFLPFGRMIGEALGAAQQVWLFALAGVVLGFLTTWSEPAVRILAEQVEEASSGSLRATIVLIAICVGVSLWVGLGMIKIAYGMPVQFLLVPGYVLVVIFLFFSDQEFVAVAVDAGGVATGPLANTFLLALALGASAAIEGQNPLIDGLGFVAIIALAPIMSVMMLGFLMRLKTRKPRVD